MSSIHSGLITADAGGRILHLNEFGAGILRPARARRSRGRDAARGLRAPPASSRRRCSARTAGRRPGPAGAVLRASRRDAGGRSGISVSPLATAGPAGRRLPAGVPGPDRHQAAGAGGAHEGEAGRGGGDGGPARPRDPQPAGLHQRVGPGPAWASPTSPPSTSSCWPSSGASRSACRDA